MARRYRPGFALTALALSAAILSAGRTQAQTYPSGKITLIVAFAAGGVADTLARMVGQGLSERLHQNVVVENRGGAGGNIAAGAVAHAPADGYTILVTTTALAINESLRETKPFTAADFRTVAIVASSPESLLTGPSNPANTLADFVQASKGKAVTFGSAGVGSGSHIAAEYFFKKIAKIEATHVPFQGGAPAMNATLGNQIDLLATTLGGGAAAQVAGGKIKGLGIAADKRVAATPDVPTFQNPDSPVSPPPPGSDSSCRPRPTRRSLRRLMPRSMRPSRIRTCARSCPTLASMQSKDRPRRPRPYSRPKSASGARWSRP